MPKWFISAEELHQLDLDNTVIFDCRFSLADKNKGRNLYLNEHIPNAFHLDMETNLSTPNQQSTSKQLHGGRHPLPDPETFIQKMQHCGVNHNSLVIAYDDNRLAGSARLWWLLKLYVHSRIKILDGGISAWKASGFLTTQETPETNSGIIKGNFSGDINSELIVDRHWVRQFIGDKETTLIDSREAPRYLGLEEPIDPIAGHIPGAINSPWQLVTDEGGFVKPHDQQKLIWQSLPISESPVVYCGSGVTACVNLLSLSLSGIDNARLYAGSWSDWCSYPANPVEPPHSSHENFAHNHS
jgi:thiosulfate/3-mercaptopyruvate sulfurtransferase